MPLVKRVLQPAVSSKEATAQPMQITVSGTIPETTTASTATPTAGAKRLGGTRKAGDKAEAPMTKDDYWRRREERDVQRDKDMAWSGMAQAVIDSMAIIQLNTTNTLDGLLDLVEKATNSLLERRDRRNG